MHSVEVTELSLEGMHLVVDGVGCRSANAPCVLVWEQVPGSVHVGCELGVCLLYHDARQN